LTAYNVNYSDSLVIRVKYSPYINTHFILSVIRDHIQSLTLPHIYRKRLIDHLRVVQTKSSDIQRSLINNIVFSKNYRLQIPPKCVCTNITSDVHTKLRSSDFMNSPIIYKVLSQNSHNIPIPTKLNAIRIVKHSILDYVQQIRRLTGYNLSTKRQNRIIRDITGQIHDSFGGFSAFRKDNQVSPELSYDSVTDIDITTTKSQLKQYIICSADKNDGECIMICPYDYHKALTKTFIDDSHYEHVYDSVEKILESFRLTYSRKKWFKLARYNKKGKLPYVYINPKYKDLNRYRPIMSYFNHPCRHVYKIAGTALTFLIMSIAEIYSHFNLFNITHMKQFVERTNHKFSELNTDSIYALFVDINNMYSEMKHKTIMNAVVWLIGITLKNNRGRDRVAIRRNKHNKYFSHFGRSYNRFTHTEIHISELVEIIEYDMNNVIFTLGNVTLRQINGIPMGGFISAPEAQLVCIYSEVQFNESLGIDQKYVSGIRYMDDLSIFIAYNKNNHQSKERVMNILQKIIHNTYDDSLILEPQPCNSDNSYSYLECRVTINESKLYLAPLHKNWESICKYGKQKLYKLQRFDSYSNTNTKIAMIVGTLHRLNNNTMNEETLYESVIKLWTELRTLKYPIKSLKKALIKMYHASHNYKWMNILLSITK
jgi:hypothetical protein